MIASVAVAAVAAAKPAAAPAAKYRVLVLGGGSAGLAVASQLLITHKRQLKPSSSDTGTLAVVDAATEHFYQPLWTLVGAGLKPMSESRRPMKEVLSHIPGAQLLPASALGINAKDNTVTLSDGRVVGYDYLVVAAGMVPRWSAIPGLSEALAAGPDSGVTSNYHPDYAPRTAQLIQQFKGSGNALFTQPSTPIKCAGAPQKIAYLAEESWRKRGLRDLPSKLRVQFCTGAGKIFAVDKYARALTQVCKQRDIEVRLQTELAEIRHDRREAVFKLLGGEAKGTTVTEKYDFLHATPPMGPPEFLKGSPVSNPAGWVDVNVRTLQNPQFRNVFSLGDCAALPVSKTAAAAAAQSKFLVDNLLTQLKADAGSSPGSATVPHLSEYDGYTSCPLVTGERKLILAEFDGFTLTPHETFHFDQSQERESMYFLKSQVLPQIYWNMMLRGAWHGPAPYRRLFNPLNRS